MAVGETEVEVELIKFLEIKIGEFLDLSCHIHNEIKKIKSVCYGIRVVANYMSERSLKMTYFETINQFWSVNIRWVYNYGTNGRSSP